MCEGSQWSESVRLRLCSFDPSWQSEHTNSELAGLHGGCLGNRYSRAKNACCIELCCDCAIVECGFNYLVCGRWLCCDSERTGEIETKPKQRYSLTGWLALSVLIFKHLCQWVQSTLWRRAGLSEMEVRCSNHSYLVDPASSHMLVSKIKPCKSKYKQLILWNCGKLIISVIVYLMVPLLHG